MKSRLSKKGFTLIELMVVVILVAILALALVPTFKEIIVKAKYTEGTSAISALRTKIKVAWLEDSMLPGMPDFWTASVISTGGMSWGASNLADIAQADITQLDAGTLPSDSSVQVMYSRDSQGDWLISNSATDTHIAFVPSNTIYVAKSGSPWQNDLEIEIADYAGAYFKNKDYQYVAINGGKKLPSYAYAIAVTGSGDRKAPPVGTAYAVLEMYNPNWIENKRVIATFDRYRAKGDNGGQMYLNIDDLGSASSIHTNKISVPNWGVIIDDTAAGLTGNDGRLDGKKLEDYYGFKAQ